MAVYQTCPGCDPLNHCAISNGGCSQICTYIDIDQSKCSCNAGYILEADGVTCTAIPRQCQFSNGGCSQICRPYNQSASTCLCNTGYILAADDKSCKPNLCFTDNGSCGKNSTCAYTLSSGIACTCNTGFTSPSGSGADCVPGSVLAAT